jgi:transcriptional regulator with XRE-family HTH domain
MAEFVEQSGRDIDAADSTAQQLRGDAVGARLYAGRRWLHQAVRVLREVRKNAGLTQEQVATSLDTTQSAVARWESNIGGSISLRNYERFVRACGYVPVDIEVKPHEAVLRTYAVGFGSRVGREVPGRLAVSDFLPAHPRGGE